jgi:hypothetical protein
VLVVDKELLFAVNLLPVFVSCSLSSGGQVVGSLLTFIKGHIFVSPLDYTLPQAPPWESIIPDTPTLKGLNMNSLNGTRGKFAERM